MYSHSDDGKGSSYEDDSSEEAPERSSDQSEDEEDRKRRRRKLRTKGEGIGVGTPRPTVRMGALPIQLQMIPNPNRGALLRRGGEEGR
ncbi:hypothetical protein C4D60_Mb09t14020 [Musa balbisiana]|nr:hypothetical protein C4D60_Mb09t14010 [Musa balbisiana]THU47297.1 hypothetical protein C4D60_Mb09t14020 [Musa balbisiana]